MPGKIEHRQISPILAFIRDLLRGRQSFYPLRFADLLAARTQPNPNVPGGPHHQLSKVYYYSRDARREVKPPVVISLGKQIEAGADKTKEVKRLTPAPVYVPKE